MKYVEADSRSIHSLTHSVASHSCPMVSLNLVLKQWTTITHNIHKFCSKPLSLPVDLSPPPKSIYILGTIEFVCFTLSNGNWPSARNQTHTQRNQMTQSVGHTHTHTNTHTILASQSISIYYKYYFLVLGNNELLFRYKITIKSIFRRITKENPNNRFRGPCAWN